MEPTTHSPAPRRRRVRAVLRWSLALTGLVVLGLAVMAYQYQTTVVRDTANRLLAPYDIEIVDITGMLLGRSQLAAATIEFRYADQPYLQSLHQVRISYRPAMVMRGFIDEIHIGEARLYSEQWPLPLPDVLTSAPDSSDPTSTASLPLGRVAIDAIHAEVAAEALSLNAHSWLQLDTFDNGQISLGAGIREGELTQPQLEIGDLELTGISAQVPEMSVECRGLTNCRMRGEFALTLAEAKQPELTVSAVSLRSALDARILGDGVTLRTTTPSEFHVGDVVSGQHTGAMIELQLDDELYIHYDRAERVITSSLTRLSGSLPMLRPLSPNNLVGFHIDLHSLRGSYQLPTGSQSLTNSQSLADSQPAAESQSPIGVQGAGDAQLQATFGIADSTSSTQFDANNLTVAADFRVRQVYTNMIPYDIWLHRFDQQVHWDGSRATLHAQAAVGDITALTLHIDQDWRDGAGTGQVRIPSLTFTPDGLNLSHVLSPFPAPGDVVTGEINAEGDFSWQASPTELAAGRWPTDPQELGLAGAFFISLHNLGGFYNETAFAGLGTRFNAELTQSEGLQGASAVPLTIEGIEAGIAASNFHANYQVDLKNAEIALNDIRLDIFGGHLRSDAFSYNLENGAGELLVNIDNIDLSEILSMSAYEAVSATGLVSGALPIRIRNLTPSVTGGQLRANEPGGTIRYDSGGAGSGNQSLDLVYQALQYYRFELLEADVDYQEDGELVLAVRMQGVSPELNEGQQINLNLNISDNIPALLESLQAGRSVTELVERRLGR